MPSTVSQGVRAWTEACLHLNCWQKCCDAGLSSIVPCHVFPDQCIEYLVASTSCLELAECEEKKEIEAVRHPVQGGDTSEDKTIPCNTAAERATVQLSGAIVCIVTKDETVYDCKYGQCGGRDGGAE